MAMVCARCNHIFEQSGSCPRCGAVPQAGVLESSPAPTPGPRWQQTAWGRILIGLVVAQGLFYGMRHLVTGILLASSEGSAHEMWTDVRNVLILQGIQLFGLVVGGVLAGGGQRSGLVLGAVVGAWNGVLSVLLRQNPAQEVTAVGLYAQPMLQAAVGAVGGMVGGLIWKPIPTSAVPTALIKLRKKPPRRKSALLAGRVSWLRVVAGIAFAVGGTLSATLIFHKVIDVSGGRLGTTHALQDRIITWEIKALVLILGGALAGSTAANGLKQGLLVALGTAVVLIGLQAPRTDAWLDVAFYTTLSTLTLCSAGGWFGGQLFPPLLKFDRRRGVNAYV
jgi:hypothetical protein